MLTENAVEPVSIQTADEVKLIIQVHIFQGPKEKASGDESESPRAGAQTIFQADFHFGNQASNL